MIKRYNDAMRRKDKMVAPVEDELPHLIDQQVAPSNFLLDKQFKAKKDKAIDVKENAAIWAKVIFGNEIFGTRRVRLKNFHIFEWFPFSPGLFHTTRARDYRAEAFHNVAYREDGLIVFNPYGKASMIKGGVGNVRLKPRNIEGRMSYFMTASSTNVCHEGFPVLVPQDIYSALISEIRERGVTTRTIEGEMRFLPAEMEGLFRNYRDVPQFYLNVEEVSKSQRPRSGVINNLIVSVAVSFHGIFRNKEGIYWTYVNFNPSDPEDVEESLHWLEKVYVQKDYRGKIITDFDEQVRRFPHAIFSLEKIMDGRLSKEEIDPFIDVYCGGWSNSDAFFKQYIYIKEVKMAKYENINLQNSIFAAENAIVTGIINVRNAGRKEIADAIEKLKDIITGTPEEQLPPEKKAESLELLNEITKKAAERSPNTTILKVLGLGFWGIIKNIEAITTAAKPLWDIVSKLWS